MSVEININLDTLTPKTARALIAALNAIGPDHDVVVEPKEESVTIIPEPAWDREATRRPIPSQMPVAIEPVDVEVVPHDFAHISDTLPSEVELEPELPLPAPSKKRGRPKKEKEAAPVATVEPEPSTPEVSEPAQPVAAPSVDDLRAALQGYTERKDMQAGIDLLREFGCARISELALQPAEVQRAFVSYCND